MKKIILIVLCFSVVFVFSCLSCELYKVSDRNYAPYPLSNELKERIRHDAVWMDDPCEVIRYSCSLTAELLSFSTTNDISNGKANCIGYAQLSTAICNYTMAFVGTRMEDESMLKVKARPVVGYVRYAGINLNKLLQKILPQKYKSFFKDHDFMEVNFGGGNVTYVDACIYDYLGSNNL